MLAMAEHKSLKDHAMELARQEWGEEWAMSHLKPIGPAFAALAADAPAYGGIAVDLRWHVLLTEPNSEQKAAERLVELGFKPFAPSFKKTTSYAVRSMFGVTRRTREVTRPLFPGYLFMPMPSISGMGSGFNASGGSVNHQQFGTATYAGRRFETAYCEIFKVNGLRTGESKNTSPFLKINGKFATVTEEAMELIKEVAHRLENPGKLRLPYKIGDSVRVLDGPFAERVAEVANLDDSARIMLLLDLLGRKTKVFVSSGQITTA